MINQYKELTIVFANQEQVFEPLVVDVKGLKFVQSAKVLRIAISNDLSWNKDVDHVKQKASKWLYFPVQLIERVSK